MNLQHSHPSLDLALPTVLREFCAVLLRCIMSRSAICHLGQFVWEDTTELHLLGSLVLAGVFYFFMK